MEFPSGYKIEKIASFHVSSQSDPFDGEQNMVGFILYSYDGKANWKLNQIHCKSGYIVIKLAGSHKGIEGRGMIYDTVYESVFGENINDKVDGGGFVYINGEWKFDSWNLNVEGNKTPMDIIEQQFIMQ